VQSTFVQLQQEHNQDEKSIEHEEEEDGLVPQLNQIRRNTSLIKIWMKKYSLHGQ
jgi:hypothetical protein